MEAAVNCHKISYLSSSMRISSSIYRRTILRPPSGQRSSYVFGRPCRSRWAPKAYARCSSPQVASRRNLGRPTYRVVLCVQPSVVCQTHPVYTRAHPCPSGPRRDISTNTISRNFNPAGIKTYHSRVSLVISIPPHNIIFLIIRHNIPARRPHPRRHRRRSLQRPMSL